MDELAKLPVMNTFPEASVQMQEALSFIEPPALFAQSTLPNASYFTTKTSEVFKLELASVVLPNIIEAPVKLPAT